MKYVGSCLSDVRESKFLHVGGGGGGGSYLFNNGTLSIEFCS
jgi:hypothetical protein